MYISQLKLHERAFSWAFYFPVNSERQEGIRKHCRLHRVNEVTPPQQHRSLRLEAWTRPPLHLQDPLWTILKPFATLTSSVCIKYDHTPKHTYIRPRLSFRAHIYSTYCKTYVHRFTFLLKLSSLLLPQVDLSAQSLPLPLQFTTKHSDTQLQALSLLLLLRANIGKEGYRGKIFNVVTVI